MLQSVLAVASHALPPPLAPIPVNEFFGKTMETNFLVQLPLSLLALILEALIESAIIQ